MLTGRDLLHEDDDQAALRALAREVADRELAPMAAHWDETGEWPEKSRAAIAQAGLYGIAVAEEHGGAGLGQVEVTIVLEELARACVNSAVTAQLTLNGPPRVIEHLGSPAMRERWLPPAATGEAVFCIGITEAEAGSAVQKMRAKLVPDGTGYRLTAYKNYSTQGHQADACLCWARFPNGEIGAVVVDMTAEGVGIAGTHRNMGLHGSTEAELTFDNVRVEPDDVLLAGSPESFRTLLFHLNHERLGNAAMCLGAAQGALEHATRYLRERPAGSRRLADLQGLQWKVSEMATELEAARLLVYRAAHLAGPHETPPALETAMAKGKANIVARMVCDEAMQLHGGYGYSREFPVERAYRDVRGLSFGGGTVEVLKNYVGARVANGEAPHGPSWRISR
jgi:alkylation response protein AidB-like acyl-CoA dehydrogenase